MNNKILKIDFFEHYSQNFENLKKNNGTPIFINTRISFVCKKVGLFSLASHFIPALSFVPITTCLLYSNLPWSTTLDFYPILITITKPKPSQEAHFTKNDVYLLTLRLRVCSNAMFSQKADLFWYLCPSLIYTF